MALLENLFDNASYVCLATNPFHPRDASDYKYEIFHDFMVLLRFPEKDSQNKGGPSQKKKTL